MPKDVLFLLRSGFASETGVPQYCPDCMLVEGVLSLYPEELAAIEVRRIDFPRPRQAIVDLVGPEKQGCPLLVRGEGAERQVLDDVREILAVFRDDYGLPAARGMS